MPSIQILHEQKYLNQDFPDQTRLRQVGQLGEIKIKRRTQRENHETPRPWLTSNFLTRAATLTTHILGEL